MPRGDGTGPPAGGGRGAGIGRGRGQGRGGGGGRMGGIKPGAGPGGECLCPKCGTTVPHQVAVPCFQMSCPSCGIKMFKK